MDKLNQVCRLYKSLKREITELKNEINSLKLRRQNLFVLTYLIDLLIEREQNKDIIPFDNLMTNMKLNEIVAFSSYQVDYQHVIKSIECLFSNCFFIKDGIYKYADRYIFWGTALSPENTDLLKNLLIDKSKKFSFAELGLISRISLANPGKNHQFSQSYSYMIDDFAPYYDARYKTRLEMLLNSYDVSNDERNRAKKCIGLILDNFITKYNDQPLTEVNLGIHKKKVLVVDQVKGDMSILKGGANDDTFEIMLSDAIKENPDADIIVKTHPVSVDLGFSKVSGYYSETKSDNRVIIYNEKINPISLLKNIDKVYVCTSQLGLEALFCKKEVITYGIPFYAGWGLTKDKQKCKRRLRERTLEELFFIVYILYTRYCDPETLKNIEIEDAIQDIIEKRREFFESYV
ncbi:MAG TPA: capsule biosynthesis protein [Succinivibrionaceae bacterium]|nr:capsule biosynthesis protein [Succinivibrionaceae bacterium]